MVEGQSAARKKNKLLEAQNLNIKRKRFSRKQNVLPDNVFQFETLHTTQACILSSNSSFFATIAALCNNMLPQAKSITNVYVFRLSLSITITDLAGNTDFLQRVQKIAYVGCNWLISIHVVGFVSS